MTYNVFGGTLNLAQSNPIFLPGCDCQVYSRNICDKECNIHV